MTRLGVVSDTHLSRLTDEFRGMMELLFRDIDYLIHAGDITGVEIYEYLCRWSLIAVRGNMDDREISAFLPGKRIETLGGKRIGITHGSGSWYGIEKTVLAQFDDVDLVIFGHSHIPSHKQEGFVQLFNPGALMRPRVPQRTVGIIEIDNDLISLKHIPLP